MFECYALTDDEKLCLDGIFTNDFIIELLEDEISCKLQLLDTFDSELLFGFYSSKVKTLQGILEKFKKFKEVYLNEV